MLVIGTVNQPLKEHNYFISLFKEKEGTDEDSMIKNVLNVSIKLINHLCFIGKLYQIIQLIEKNPNSHN